MELKQLYEETIVNLISSPQYVNKSFYGFILAKCKVHFDDSFPTLGVYFENNTWNLMIGDIFKRISFNERIGVLIHETRHILDLHMSRMETRKKEIWNIAADIAINQTIEHIPEEGVFPETFDFPKNESAETYYELLIQEQEKQEQEKQEAEENGESWDGPGENSQGKQKPDLTNMDQEGSLGFDDHSKWEELSEEEKELAKSTAEQMVKEAITQSRGNLPGDIEQILNLLRRKPKISWKKELRNILSSRSGSKIETIKKRNRRFPGRPDLRGKKIYKDRPIVIVGVDTSGSMDDSDILNGLSEIYYLMKNIGELKIAQIDTEIKDIEKYDPNKFKSFKRKGYGGTLMEPLPDYIMENRESCDVLIMISDCWIEDVESSSVWQKFKKPVLWLNTSGTKAEWDGWNKHKIFNIHDV